MNTAQLKALEAQTIAEDDEFWVQWQNPEDVARVIPAESLADECKRQMLLGAEYAEGLRLPWAKTHDRTLIRPGKVCVWTGWSHHGKTAMLKQAMLYAIKHGEKVLIASMEEEPRDLWQDLCVMYTGGPNPTPSAIDEFVENIRGRLWIYDQQGVVSGMRVLAVIRFASHILGVTQSVIDSLMMLSLDRDDYDAQSKLVSYLKSVAKDMKCTIHLVAHMRKRDSRGDDSPGTPHDIAGGHEIASKADYVFNVWRNKKENDGPDCILGVEKQRGRKPYNWIGRISLNYHSNTGTFVEGNTVMQFGRQA